MSLKCQKTQRLLSDYIDGTLSERQMKDVALHLDTCWTCKREAIDLKKTCHLLENFYVEPEASDAYYARFTKTLQQRIEQNPPTTFHEQVRGIGARLTWQVLARVRRYIDRCVPTGLITVRQKMLPYYVLVVTMMTLLVAPLVLKQLPTGENGEHVLGHLYAVAKARLFSTSTPLSHQPAATLAIQQDQTTTQPAEIRRNVSRSRTTETPTVDSGSDLWQFTDDPVAEGYILTTLRKNSKDTLSSVALDIDSELLAHAELPSQGTPGEYPTDREVLTDGRYAVLLLQGIRSGQHALQQYKRKWSQFKGFSRKLLDVPLETLSITEVYDSIEL
jgi:anti-sigma factor RsiW